jgi:hypothetical protein
LRLFRLHGLQLHPEIIDYILLEEVPAAAGTLMGYRYR